MKKFFRLLREGTSLSLFVILTLASIVYGVGELGKMFSSTGLGVVMKLAAFLIHTAIGIAGLCIVGSIADDEE